MNNQKHIKTVFSYIILAVGLLYVTAQYEPVLGAESALLPVGRDNPFAKITRPTNPSPIAALLGTSKYDEEKPELFMQTVMLKFLDAKSLQQAVSMMCSEFGTVAINQKNNSLIICDTKENLTAIVSEIEKADRTPQQIMIEVVIVDVQLRDETEIGVNWDLLSDKNYDIIYRQNFTNRLGSTVADAETIGNATAFNTTGIGGDFSVISGTIRNVVATLQTKRDVEILASPRAMMVSGESANIKAVEEIPYSEVSDTAAGGAGAITSTKFKEVGVNLQVSGTITDGNNIFLTVDTEQNVMTSESTTGVPVVDTRKATTSLLLKDGQIVVIGGLRRQQTTKEVDQIPILGDIPLIGLLFKYTNTVINNTELIVFLSPHIYKEGEPIPEDMMSKFNEITDKPMLLLPKEAKQREHRNQLDQSAKERTAAIEQLQQKIAECELMENGLKQHRERLEKSMQEQASVNEQLQKDIAKFEQAEAELKEYRNQIDQRIQEQNAANEQLQLHISEGKQAERDLQDYRAQLRKRLEEQSAAAEQLQLEIAKRKQAQRDNTKEKLLNRMKELQNKKDEDSVKELLSTLASLNKILSQEMEETLNSSKKVLANEGK
jgi:Flp pilus assembly secretin CpaC